MLVAIEKTEFFPYVIWAFVLGMMIAAFYDVFRIRRYAFRRTKTAARIFSHISALDTLLCFFEDIAVLLFSAVVFILLSFKLSHGVPRWYGIFSMLCGFMLYRKTFGRLVMLSAGRILRGLYRLLKFILRKILLPLKKPFTVFFGRINDSKMKAVTEKREKVLLKEIEKKLQGLSYVCDNSENEA